MNLSAWSVRTRLTAGFGLVCALMFFIIVAGLIGMSRMGSGVIDVVDDRIPKIEAANAILEQADAVAIAVRDMVIFPDPADRQKQTEVVEKAREIIDKNVDFLERLIALPKGKELLNNVKEMRSQFRAGQKEFIALITADKPDEAKTYLTSQLRPRLKQYKDAISAIIAFQKEVLETSTKKTSEAYEHARSTQISH